MSPIGPQRRGQVLELSVAPAVLIAHRGRTSSVGNKKPALRRGSIKTPTALIRGRSH
jgi:hypothetical protein